MTASLLFFVFAAAVPLAVARVNETYIYFKLTDPSEIHLLTQIVSIDQVQGNNVWAYATDDELQILNQQGYRWEKLNHPGENANAHMADSIAEIMTKWDVFPTYEQYVELMSWYAASYPNICQLVEIGRSQEGRLLLGLEITKNPDVDEIEPEVFLSSTMHGDETAGFVLMLHLINDLLTGYSRDVELTFLVNNLDIWINPLANPDGTYANGNSSVRGAKRMLSNGVDFNRNFPDPESEHPDGHEWAPETRAMMDFAEVHRFVLSANFHGGAEVVNYPWDTWPKHHADNDWFVNVSRKYATQAQLDGPHNYMKGLENGIVMGSDWYEVNGGRQDYMVYFRGGREVTIELSVQRNLSAQKLPIYWQANRRALLGYLANAFEGIRGVVSDMTMQPLSAVIEVLDHDADGSSVYTDPEKGDYYRLIAPGAYDLRISAPGYQPLVIPHVTVTPGTFTQLNVQLTPIL